MVNRILVLQRLHECQVCIAHNVLTHFKSMFYFYIPWKHQKTFGFLIFSGGIEIELWLQCLRTMYGLQCWVKKSISEGYITLTRFILRGLICNFGETFITFTLHPFSFYEIHSSTIIPRYELIWSIFWIHEKICSIFFLCAFFPFFFFLNFF